MSVLRRSYPPLLALALAACDGGSPSDPDIREEPPTVSNGGIPAVRTDGPTTPASASSSPVTFPTPPGLGGLLGGLGGGFGAAGTVGGGPPPRLGALRTAAKTPPAISGGTLAVDKAGSIAVVGDSDRDMIYLVDLTTAGVRKLKLAAGSEPGRVALDGNKAAHVALRGTGKVAHVDLSAGTWSESDVCPHPRGIAVDGPRARVVVACVGGQILELDSASHGVVARRADLPNDLRDVILGPSGVEAVSRYRSAELVQLGSDGTPRATARPRDGQRLVLQATPTLPIVLPFDPSVDAGATVPPPSFAPVPPPTPALVPMKPTLAWRALRAADGQVWMLHQQSQEAEVNVSQGGGYGSGGCSTITGGKVSRLDDQGNTLSSMSVPMLGLSVDAALSPNGKWLAIASPGGYLTSNGTLQLFKTESMQAGETGDCRAPTRMSGEEDQITAVTYDDNNVLYAFAREPAELVIFTEPVLQQPIDSLGVTSRLERKAVIALDLSSARDTGHDMFHADVGSGIACASCHGEALDDAHVWSFEKIGPRRTQNMRGGLLATAPFHWDGDMTSINHLVDEVMTRRMGGFKVLPEFAGALGGWIDRLPAVTLPAGDASAVARGKTLFNAPSTQCATCHSGKNFTNNESRDVGTGGIFQVPSLLGLPLRGPYMHNGCAKTLEERFTPACGGGDKHGVTSKLSAGEVADLIAYLKTL